MGIWSTFAPVGYLIILNIAPLIGKSFPWQAIWWINAALASLFFVLFGLLFRMPKEHEIQQERNPRIGPEEEKHNFREGICNRNLWLITIAFISFSFVQMGFSTFYPTYLNEKLGFSLASASFLVSVQMIVLTAPLIGWISDRIKSRKIVLIIGLGMMGVLMITPFSMAGYGAILTYMIVRGIFEDSTPTMCYASVPEVVTKPQYVGIAMAMMGFGQGLGNVFGPPVFGWVVEMTNNWAFAGYAMIPVILVGLVAAWFIQMR